MDSRTTGVAMAHAAALDEVPPDVEDGVRRIVPSVSRCEERRIPRRCSKKVQALARVVAEDRQQAVGKRDQAGFVEFGLADGDDPLGKVHITDLKLKGLADPQTCRVEQDEECSVRVGAKGGA